MYRFLHPLEIESLPPWDPTTEDTLCTLESVKAVGEVYAPVDCEAWSWSPHVLLMKFEMVYKWCINGVHHKSQKVILFIKAILGVPLGTELSVSRVLNVECDAPQRTWMDPRSQKTGDMAMINVPRPSP